MRNKKGFTLIELLAVIVILGLLLAIAIPTITRYITESRKKTLATTISKYVDSGLISVNNGEYIFNERNVIYAIPIECIPIERGGDNPFGEWNQVNNKYWAYVLVQYNPEEFSYKYGFTFKDGGGYGMHPVSLEDMDVKGRNILTNLELAQPRTGLASNFSTIDYWNESGFNVNEETRVKVLHSRLEGETGDGQSTCTLHNKGLNYGELEEIKTRSGTLVNSGADINLVFGKEMDRSLIEEIYTLDYVEIPTDAIDSWDASIQNNESVMAYITDKDEDNLYELYLAQEGGVIAPANSFALFKNFNQTTIMELNKLNTEKMTSMGTMFEGCPNLIKLNVSNFDTSKVTSMVWMFSSSSKLANLDVSNWNTSNVTSMSGMFAGLSSVKKLDVSNFDTSKVKSMDTMFSGMSSLIDIDVSNFNTSNVTIMNNMFWRCYSLRSLDVSKWNTTNVTNMSYMFSAASSIANLDLSNFNTDKVKNMASMFSEMTSLTSLNLSGFRTTNVENMASMFAKCSLSSVDLSHFDTSKVKSMNSMFSYISLDKLNLDSFNTENVTDMSSMFQFAKIKSIDLSHFDTSNLTTARGMFYFSNIDTVNLSGWTNEKLQDIANMFYRSSVANIDFTNFNTPNVTTMNGMFTDNKVLTKLDLSSFNTNNVKNISSIFQGTEVTSINLSNADFTNITNYTNMFLSSKNPIIYVKDEIQKEWFTVSLPSLTNVKIIS